MDSIQLGALVVGGIVPFITALLKRWIVLDKKQNAFLTLAISFVFASIYELLVNGFDWKKYIEKIGLIYTSSQAIYWLVLQDTSTERKLEGIE